MSHERDKEGRRGCVLYGGGKNKGEATIYRQRKHSLWVAPSSRRAFP